MSNPDQRLAGFESWQEWRVPLSAGHLTLSEAYETLRPIGLAQRDIPFIIQLVEHPKYDVPGIDLFPGAVDLRTHDLIHIVLGRIRAELGIEEDLLRAYYAIEKRRYPDSRESQRLLD